MQGTDGWELGGRSLLLLPGRSHLSSVSRAVVLVISVRRGEEGTKEGTKEIAFLLEASPCRGVVIASFGSCLQARELYAAFLDLSSDAEDMTDGLVRLLWAMGFLRASGILMGFGFFWFGVTLGRGEERKTLIRRDIYIKKRPKFDGRGGRWDSLVDGVRLRELDRPGLPAGY